jgi:hypothetical protein
MLSGRKKGTAGSPAASVVPAQAPVWSALERAGAVVVMRKKPDTKPSSRRARGGERPAPLGF